MLNDVLQEDNNSEIIKQQPDVRQTSSEQSVQWSSIIILLKQALGSKTRGSSLPQTSYASHPHFFR